MVWIVLLYGLIIGSFLNVCIYRIPNEKSIIMPNSYCPKCDNNLKWYDNIPLISYIYLLGRCRYCKDKISLQYPIIEILNTFVYIVLFYKFKLSIDFVFLAVLSSLLIIIFFIDLKHMIIPDILIIIILILTILYKIVNYYIYDMSLDIINSLIGFIISGFIFLFIIIVSQGGMGGGDLTLISALGFILGIKLILLNIFLSFIVGAFISILLLIFKIKSRDNPIPFGPFIILSFYIVVFYGNDILNWYYYRFII